MADTHPDIKPNGLTQAHLVDALYMIVSSIAGICAKLDADGGVPLTTYTANCYTAIFNTVIEDSKGNRTGRGGEFTITPAGITPQALTELLYEITNSLETLPEQLDTDVLTLSNYEATAFTAVMLQQCENQVGNTVGNGYVFYFRPGAYDQAQLVEFLFNAFTAINLICEDNTTTGLDVDGTVTDVDYNALWYTANMTLKIENAAGSQIGN